MQLIVEKFENVLNKGKQSSKTPFIDGKYFTRSTLFQGKSGLGGVDAMMKKDIKSIVAAYQKRIQKDPLNFKAGEVELEVKVSTEMMGPTETIVIKGIIVK